MKKIITSILAASALFLVSSSASVFAENSADIDITINQSLTLTLSETALELQADQTLDTDYMTITGSTNNETGFKISFNVNNPYNDLKHENATIRENIPSLTEDATESTFPETAWGYTIETENQTFKKLPLTSENIFSTEENGQETYNFGLGAKVAADQAAGRYENELIFTIVANPIPPKTISRIKTMQQITPEICAASAEHETAQLKDTRDNKTYWVTKLKDNNCWMTQNLDYDLSVAENQTLTPATSNVTENRTVVPANTDLATFASDYNSVYYLDGGDTYYANGTTKTEGLSTLPADSTDRHYAQGDYYSWKAATAGQGTTSITNADVNESICPAGWRLPTSNSADANYSFGNLVKQYGYTGTTQLGATDATLLASPLFFARGGFVYSGALGSQGSGGGYWSSRASSGSYGAYFLVFDSSDVYPSYDLYYRSFGFSVRCVAQGKDLSSISTMQEMTPEIVLKTPVDTSKQLIDTRDGKKYWVTKLADGNIWMTQNLDYDLSTTITLTPEDSDVTANWTPSSTTIAGAANLNNWTENYNNPYSFDPGNYYFDGTYYDSVECNYLTTTCDHFATTPYDLNGEHGHIGNYYNWSAAVASNDTSATTVAGTDINTSICPKGWRLPHGDRSTQGNDFATLNTAYGGATNSDSVLLANPLFFVRGGRVYSGSLISSASYGLYWSSTAFSATSADYLFFRSGFVYPSNYDYRNLGFSVRCLAR